MLNKKGIPVKYFYYGMFVCTFLICSLFFLLRQRESQIEKVLNERGIKANAWVMRLFETKTSKKTNPNYYMEVGFFADTTKALIYPDINPSAETLTSGDKVLKSFAKQTESSRRLNGDFETQTITLYGYQIYNSYKVTDKLKVQFLPEDHSIIRIVNN